MKTGILGGTFNPIHKAHLAIAEVSMRRCGLDRILFLPAAIPPHKEIAANVSFTHRMTMVALATADTPEFICSDLEAKRQGASFSVDTLAQLRDLYPGDELYFIIGLDSFRDITTWKNYQRLFELSNIIVAGRPGPGAEAPEKLLPVAIKDDFCYDERSLKLRHKSGHQLIFIIETKFDISSTGVRKKVAEGLPIEAEVPTAVIDYIEQNNLYRE
ncbi:MAG: nicotinate (nicotinamide) nucleotide adenylyltransferase [Desulfuromonas sp.]|nr:MAG: nicotinate (nicotinamide) nucleotide adenylyltransferase [Desulfuromonas sp.]